MFLTSLQGIKVLKFRLCCEISYENVCRVLPEIPELWRLCLQDSLTVVVEDLRLCSVKPCEDIERRFCFEVVSPTK